MVGGLAAMMDSPDEVTGPINLGNPDEQTVLELADRIISMTGSKSKIEFGPLPKDDPQKRRPDISLAIEKLHWRPTIALEVGLARTIGYFRRQFAVDFAG